MNVDQMRALVCVVELGSFTAAADRLGLHKAAVRRHISELERRLGARLLERSTRAVRLTEVGREPYDARCPPHAQHP